MIDELHLFAEGARGTQLQVLLARLDEVTGVPGAARLGISATVPSPDRLAARFLGAKGQSSGSARASVRFASTAEAGWSHTGEGRGD